MSMSNATRLEEQVISVGVHFASWRSSRDIAAGPFPRIVVSLVLIDVCYSDCAGFYMKDEDTVNAECAADFDEAG